MAKFPIQMNGVEVYDVEALKKHFDLDVFLQYRHKLVGWLKGGDEEELALRVKALSADISNDTWLDKVTREEHTTFSIITTDTNPLTDYIHNSKHRMPAILSLEDEEKWLNPDLSKTEISSLLKPYDAKLMDAYVIENDFIKKAPTDPSILQRA